jgi:hypothetical protein
MDHKQLLEVAVAAIATFLLLFNAVQGLRCRVITCHNRRGNLTTIARDSAPFAYWLTLFLLVLAVLSIWTCVIYDCVF